MAANIGEIARKVETRIQDAEPRLTRTELAGDIDQAILSARDEYQIPRPRERVAKVAGAGVFDYRLDDGSTLAGWSDGFSSILEIVYPYVVTDREPTILDETTYAVIRLDTGVWLRFRSATPAAGEFFLATYTTPHTITEATSTVVLADDEAFADLAAAICFEKLAAVYAQDTDSSVQADSTDRKTKSELYLSLARALRARYEQKLQIGKAQGPASRMVRTERRFGDIAQTEHFFHARRAGQ